MKDELVDWPDKLSQGMNSAVRIDSIIINQLMMWQILIGSYPKHYLCMLMSYSNKKQLEYIETIKFTLTCPNILVQCWISFL